MENELQLGSLERIEWTDGLFSFSNFQGSSKGFTSITDVRKSVSGEEDGSPVGALAFLQSAKKGKPNLHTRQGVDSLPSSTDSLLQQPICVLHGTYTL